jgi:hypothetical protein
MSASVSSEWAFSSGGITISKRRNRLKGDIVEALQCVKCVLRHDLLFRETGPSSLTEDDESESEAEAEAREKSGDSEDEEEGWDTLILEDSDDKDDGVMTINCFKVYPGWLVQTNTDELDPVVQEGTYLCCLCNQ